MRRGRTLQAPERTLRLEFILEEVSSTSPSDFLNFVAYADGFVKSYIEAELLSVADDFEFPSAWKVQIVEEARRLLRALPAPAEVRDVRHGSPWALVLAIPAAIFLPFVYRCLNPVIREAWNDSNLKDRLFLFMRDQVFRGAKKKAEDQAALTPSRRSIKVRDVKELSGGTGNPAVEIRLTRKDVIEISVSDERLLEEFRERLLHK